MASEDARENEWVRFLRDSALVLAAVTALLYLASHVYATSYLAVFGVYGFDTVGLSQFALIPVTSAALVLGLVWVVYRTLKTLSTKRFVLGLVTITLACSARVLIEVGCGVMVGWGDIGSLGWTALVLYLLSAWHVGIRRRLRKIGKEGEMMWGSVSATNERARAAEARLRELSEELTSLESDLAQSERDLHEMQRALLRPSEEHLAAQQERVDGILEAIEETRTSIERQHSVIHMEAALVRVGLQMKVLMWVFAAYIAAVSGLPAVAVADAVTSLRQEHWKPARPGDYDRTPVYWIGDRAVFVTSGRTGCYVHVVIANVEQGQRECPHLVAAIEP